jgi:hypothetical protein
VWWWLGTVMGRRWSFRFCYRWSDTDRVRNVTCEMACAANESRREVSNIMMSECLHAFYFLKWTILPVSGRRLLLLFRLHRSHSLSSRETARDGTTQSTAIALPHHSPEGLALWLNLCSNDS